MATSSQGLSRFKSSGNALIDALNIMGMFPTPAGMAAEGPDAIKSIGEILGIAKGEGIPKEESARKAMIDAFKAKGETTSPTAAVNAPTVAPSMDMSASESVKALGKRAPKSTKMTAEGYKPSGKMSDLMSSWGQGIDNAVHQDTMDTATKLRDTYKYLKAKLPDTGTKAYGWDTKLKNLESYMTHRLNKAEFNKAPIELRDRIRRELGVDLSNAQNILNNLLKGK